MADSLKKGFIIIISATFLSKAFGFARELVIASKFGISEDFDVLLAIFAIPTAITSLFIYAVPHIIIPRLDLNQQSKAKFYLSFSQGYFWVYILLLFCIAFLYIIFSYLFLQFDIYKTINENKLLVSKLLLLFGLYIFIYSIYAILKAVYNAKQKFILPAFSPLIIHLSIIFTVLLFHSYGVICFAYGLVIGSILQLLIYYFDFRRQKILKYFRFGIKPNKLELSAYFIIFFIELLGQTYTLIDRFFIEKLPEGHISSLYYANTLNNLPVTIIGMSLGTLLFPEITRLVQLDELNKLKNIIFKALLLSFLAGLSIFIIFFVFGDTVISILFERGKFDDNAVYITNSYLVYLAIGLPLILVHVILAKLSFAFHKERLLLLSTIMALILKFLLSNYFINQNFFQGLAFATSISFLLNVMIMLIILYKRFLKVNTVENV